MIKYYYSETLGLQEVRPNQKIYKDSFNTKDEAVVQYYKKIRTGKANYISELELKLKRRKNELQELDKKYSYLKEKFPELFL